MYFYNFFWQQHLGVGTSITTARNSMTFFFLNYTTSLNNYKSQNPDQAFRYYLQGSVSGILANSGGDNFLPLQRLGAAVSGLV